MSFQPRNLSVSRAQPEHPDASQLPRRAPKTSMRMDRPLIVKLNSVFTKRTSVLDHNLRHGSGRAGQHSRPAKLPL